MGLRRSGAESSEVGGVASEVGFIAQLGGGDERVALNRSARPGVAVLSTPDATRTHATGFGGRCSIQLSYRGLTIAFYHKSMIKQDFPGSNSAHRVRTGNPCVFLSLLFVVYLT